MKHIKLILTVITIILSYTAQAQWQKVYHHGLSNAIYTIGENILLPHKTAGLVMSMDSGKTWEQVSNYSDINYMNKITASDSGLFISADHNVYRSIDSGKSWSYVSSWPYGLFGQITASGQNLIAGSSDYSVIISKDYGKTWDSSNTGLPSLKYGTAPFYHMRQFSGFITFGSKTMLFSVGPGEDLFESYDHGLSWVPLKSNLVTDYISSNLVYKKSIFVARDGLFRSNDSGSTWQTVYTPKSPMNIVRLLAAKGKILIAGVDNEGVIMSVDDGDNWKFINEGIDTLTTRFGMAINGGYAFCATETGAVYRRSLSEFTSISPEKTPNEALNIRIYPNPLDRFATFEFSRELHSGVLKLYNMRGQEVVKISNINESKTQFLRENLAAGTYIYFVNEGRIQLASGKISFI